MVYRLGSPTSVVGPVPLQITLPTLRDLVPVLAGQRLTLLAQAVRPPPIPQGPPAPLTVMRRGPHPRPGPLCARLVSHRLRLRPPPAAPPTGPPSPPPAWLPSA